MFLMEQNESEALAAMRGEVQITPRDNVSKAAGAEGTL